VGTNPTVRPWARAASQTLTQLGDGGDGPHLRTTLATLEQQRERGMVRVAVATTEAQCLGRERAVGALLVGGEGVEVARDGVGVARVRRGR